MASTSLQPSTQSHSLASNDGLFARAQAIEKSSPAESIELYRQVIFDASADPKMREQAIMAVAVLLPSAKGLLEFARSLKAAWPSLPRARPATIVRRLLDRFAAIADSQGEQLVFVEDLLAWTEQDNRAVLRRTLQARYAQLLYEARRFTDALAVIHPLARELARIDDKLALIEVQLLEGKVFMELRNLPKAKAAFTAARTTGNLVCSPPLVQAALDIQTGKLYIEEGECTLAYANFIEALDAYSSEKHAEGAVQALSYMLLAKIMAGQTSEIDEILRGKLAVPYAGQVDPLPAIAKAYANRSLAEYDAILASSAITSPFIATHLRSLYDTLLQGNLLKLITPYSRVEIAYIAGAIGLDVHLIEGKLCQMILDKVLFAIIDQETGTLIRLDKPKEDIAHKMAIQTIKNLNKVVEGLYQKAARLH